MTGKNIVWILGGAAVLIAMVGDKLGFGNAAAAAGTQPVRPMGAADTTARTIELALSSAGLGGVRDTVGDYVQRYGAGYGNRPNTDYKAPPESSDIVSDKGGYTIGSGYDVSQGGLGLVLA